MKKFVLMLLMVLGAMPAFADQTADKILGTYSLVEPETGTKSKVQITKQPDGTYKGVVVWAEKTVPANKKVILKGFHYDASKKMWVDGTVYNPANDKTYKSQINFESDKKLKIRGYIGTPAFGKTVYWTKI